MLIGETVQNVVLINYSRGGCSIINVCSLLSFLDISGYLLTLRWQFSDDEQNIINFDLRCSSPDWIKATVWLTKYCYFFVAASTEIHRVKEVSLGLGFKRMLNSCKLVFYLVNIINLFLNKKKLCTKVGFFPGFLKQPMSTFSMQLSLVNFDIIFDFIIFLSGIIKYYTSVAVGINIS